jgi:hypothetical protein
MHETLGCHLMLTDFVMFAFTLPPSQVLQILQTNKNASSMGRMFGHQTHYLSQMLQFSSSGDPVVDNTEADADR